MTVLGRLVAFLDNVWSFILTLVRSLLALFSFRRRRSSDPFSLPSVNRTPKDAIARAQSRLRPILLTPRSITRVPVPYPPRVRYGSATSTLNAAPSASAPPGPQRTSPKLDPDTEPAAVPETDQAAPSTGTGTGTVSREGTPDTSLPTTHTTSLSVQPLTPPDRCYLAPMPSRADCPYTESWPSNDGAPDRNSKPRLPGSPLKASSINTDPTFPQLMVGPIGSPPPAHWSPTQIWTTTSSEDDDDLVPPVPMPDPTISPFDSHAGSPHDPSSALANISHALISRSHSSVEPYDAASTTTTESSDASLFVNASNEPDPTLQQTTRDDSARADNEHFAQFHRPEAYVRAWRVPGRPPGKPSDRTSFHAFATARSYSHTVLPTVSEWYNADAYVPSPMSVLSPPHGESATEDEDEMPLGRLRERLTFRSRHSLAVPLDVGIRKAAAMSPRSRRMSEGCLLAISESTPTRVGIGARPRRKATAMALEDEDSYGYKDWLEALSLRYPSEGKDTLPSAPGSRVAVPPVDRSV